MTRPKPKPMLPRGSYAWHEDGIVYQLTGIVGESLDAPMFLGIWHEDGLSGKAYIVRGIKGEARDLALALVEAERSKRR